MFYKAYLPHQMLRPFIKCIWILEANAAPGKKNKEKILTDGCIEMIFHYGDAFKRVNGDGIAETQPGNFVIGQLKKYIEIEPTGNTGVIGIRFYPNGLSAFTNIPVYEFTGQSITLDNIFGSEIIEVQNMLPELCHEQKIDLLQALLVRKAGCNKKFDFTIDNIVKKILLHKGQVQLHPLLKHIKISERHFERRFKNVVGVSPKFFARLTRFQNIMQLAQAGDNTKLVSLSYLGGYYDQAHFIKDFKEFTGENPRDYFNTNHTLSSLFLSE